MSHRPVLWYMSAYDQPGGASSRTFDYACEFALSQCTVYAFTNTFCQYSGKHSRKFNGFYSIERIDNVNVVWLKSISYRGNGFLRLANMCVNSVLTVYASFRLRKCAPPDIIISPSVPLLLGFFGWLVSVLTSARFVFEVRDVWPQTLVDLGALKQEGLLYWFLRKMEKHLYRKAVKISVVLPDTKQHVIDSGCNGDKVFWHPNAKKLQFKSLDVTQPDNDRYYVTYVGGFALTHDVENILLAADALNRQGVSGVFFKIYGHGLQYQYIESLIEEMSLDNVKLFGIIPKNQVPKVLADSDLLVACVKDSPAYQFGINSNKLVDYLAAGKPIIFCGRAPQDPIMLSGAGYSIPPSDPALLAETITKARNLSVDELKKMANNAYNFLAENLDLSVIAKRYLTEILR